jgi:hypothetical protein
MMGASGAVMALLVLFACQNPWEEIAFLFLIRLPVWVVAVALVAIDFAMLLNVKHSSGIASAAHLGGAAFGYLWYWGHPRIVAFFENLERRIEMRERAEARELETRMDEILRKIKDFGMEGLTRDERSFLDRASKHFRKQKKS